MVAESPWIESRKRKPGCRCGFRGAGFISDNGGELIVLGRIEILGIPPDFFLEIMGHEAHVEFPDGKSVSSSLDYPWGFFHDWGVSVGFDLQKDIKVLNESLPRARPTAVPLLSLDRETLEE